MYIIMSINSLNGYLAGHFKSLFHLFLKSTTKVEDRGTDAEWTNLMDEAMQFETEEAALTYVHDIWGNWFSDHNHVVVRIPETILEENKEIFDIIRRTTNR